MAVAHSENLSLGGVMLGTMRRGAIGRTVVCVYRRSTIPAGEILYRMRLIAIQSGGNTAILAPKSKYRWIRINDGWFDPYDFRAKSQEKRLQKV